MLSKALAGGLVIINITTLLLTVEDTSEARREEGRSTDGVF